MSRVRYACSDWTGTACASPDSEFFYEYDGAGNLLRFDKWNASTSQVETVRYVINGANQIQCVDDISADGQCDDGETLWDYDAFGNLLSDGMSTYVYDTANRLSSVTNATGTTSYVYSGDGDRIAQTVNGVTTTYVLDTATPLTMVLSETTGTSTIRYWHGLDLVAQSDGTATTYLSYDGLGSVRQLTDTSALVQLAQTFDPYGTLYSDAGTNSTRYAFTGEYQDDNGLLYLRARYYHAGSGRFTQMDPSRQERNAYQYSAGNPILLTDPSGYTPQSCSVSPDPVSCYRNYARTHPDMVDIPYVDDNGYVKDQNDWYGWQTGHADFLSAGARRGRAALRAQEWANGYLHPAGDLPWGDTTGAELSETDSTKCNDCIMFVSYILWRVGFRMTGVEMRNNQPRIYDAAGWANTKFINKGFPGATNAFLNVYKFTKWWTTRQNKEQYPRASVIVCKSTSECARSLWTMQPGDVILYDYKYRSSPALDPGNSEPELEWNHAAMAIGRNGLKLDIASRGGLVEHAKDSNTWDCTGGWPLIGYLDPNETGNRTFENGRLLRVGLMHIQYENYSVR